MYSRWKPHQMLMDGSPCRGSASTVAVSRVLTPNPPPPDPPGPTRSEHGTLWPSRSRSVSRRRSGRAGRGRSRLAVLLIGRSTIDDPHRVLRTSLEVGVETC